MISDLYYLLAMSGVYDPPFMQTVSLPMVNREKGLNKGRFCTP